MSIILIKMGIAISNFIYFFIKLFPIKKNKVTFISRQSNNASIDFNMIVEKLKEEDTDCKIVLLCKRLENGIFSQIKYCFHILRQMYHIATSKVVVLDSYCIPICILKHKKSLVVIQIWHALGSLKKFGYSSLDKKDGRSSKIAKAMRMHYNYTYILTSSKVSKKYFMEAFNAKEEQMKVMNLPRVDFLKSKITSEEIKNKFYEIYQEANNDKKIILYCPTQRKSGKVPLGEIIEEIPFEKYNLMVKLHNGKEILYTNKGKILKGRFFTGMELLHVGDYIITDYSAIVYEAAITKKPIYFYAYDYINYMQDRGTYIDYKKEMPGPICEDFKQIIEMIESNYYDEEKEEEFCHKYIENLEKNATEQLTDFILGKIKE